MTSRLSKRVTKLEGGARKVVLVFVPDGLSEEEREVYVANELRAQDVPAHAGVLLFSAAAAAL